MTLPSTASFTPPYPLPLPRSSPPDFFALLADTRALEHALFLLREVPLIQRFPWLQDQDQHAMTLTVKSVISDHDKRTQLASFYHPYDLLDQPLDRHQRFIHRFPWLQDQDQHAMTLLVTSVISDYNKRTQIESYYTTYAPMETTPDYINLVGVLS